MRAEERKREERGKRREEVEREQGGGGKGEEAGGETIGVFVTDQETRRGHTIVSLSLRIYM